MRTEIRVSLADPSIEFIKRLLFAQAVGVYCTTSSGTHAFVVVVWLGFFNILRFYEGRKRNHLSTTYKSYSQENTLIDLGKLHWHS